jgi:hypothetical protein
MSAAETGRNLPASAKGKKVMKVFISDGTEEPLVGMCVYFLREKREEINSTNVSVN